MVAGSGLRRQQHNDPTVQFQPTVFTVKSNGTTHTIHSSNFDRHGYHPRQQRKETIKTHDGPFSAVDGHPLKLHRTRQQKQQQQQRHHQQKDKKDQVLPPIATRLKEKHHEATENHLGRSTSRSHPPLKPSHPHHQEQKITTIAIDHQGIPSMKSLVGWTNTSSFHNGTGLNNSTAQQPTTVSKRRYILRPQISHSPEHQLTLCNMSTPSKDDDNRSSESQEDDQIVVANILEGITSLCLGPTDLFTNPVMKKKKRRNGNDRTSKSRRPDRHSPHDSRHGRSTVTKNPPPAVTDPSQTHIDGKSNDAHHIGSVVAHSESIHRGFNNNGDSRLSHRRPSSLISTSSLSPSSAILPGPSKRKRVVYPIATYEGSKLNCHKLIKERRQVFHQNLFRPVSNDEMSHSTITTNRSITA